jgi:large subunit ribosomal protein L9
MKVILTEYVYLHGVAGDVVEVADGFARNYLIPRGKAVKATPAAIERNKALMDLAVTRRKELNARLVDVAQKIDGVELVFGRKAGRNNKLYGSVTTNDIAKSLYEKTGVDIDRRRVSERPLRELGRFEVPIRMGPELSPIVHIVILPEEEVENYLRGEAVEIPVPVAEEAAEAETEAGPETGDATMEAVATEVRDVAPNADDSETTTTA